MNFFSFHIGDYAAHTKHLTLIEDIAYRRMLDLYYTSEKPLPLDPAQLARLIGMRDHLDEVNVVVSDFFTKTEDGYRSKRCDEEIAIYHSKLEQASRAGKASAQRRFNAGSTDVQPTNNQEPITNNQLVIKHPSGVALLKQVEGLPDQIAADFLKVRKAKRSPLTATALAMIEREAKKAGITTAQAIAIAAARGWQSFKSDWDWKQKGQAQKTMADRMADATYGPLLETGGMP